MHFRIKGSYYYSAELAENLGALTLGKSLRLVPEPTNEYDPHAIQIWLQHPRYLLGYVPRQETQRFHFWLKFHLIDSFTLTGHEKQGKKLYATLHFKQPWWYPFAFYLFQKWTS